jgi:hypothetical protein
MSKFFGDENLDRLEPTVESLKSYVCPEWALCGGGRAARLILGAVAAPSAIPTALTRRSACMNGEQPMTAGGMRQRLWLVLVLVLMGWSSPSMGEQRTVVYPADSGAELGNPGMGWIFPYYDNSLDGYGARLEPSDTVDDFPGLAVIQLRIAWSFIEPNEGDFNWSLLDTPTQRWIDKGKQIALRITCSEPGMIYATPKWVQDAGAKGYLCTWGEWEPDFDDPVFLEKLDVLLAALAARYDGNRDVAFIDVGSFGGWGEGHTFATSGRTYPCSTVIKHIDLHLKHFKHTLLTANDDFAFQGDEPIDFELRKRQGMEIIRYALEKGLTLRDDSILVEGGDRAYYNAAMAQLFWPTVPVIIESCHYGLRRDQGVWGDGSKYLEALEEYHASYASIHWWPREFLVENRELVRQMNLRMGYRLQLTEASWPSQLTIAENTTLRFTSKWRNAGVAPCLPGGNPAVTLKDSVGGIVGVFVDQGFDVRSLAVGPPGRAKVRNQEATFVLRRPIIYISDYGDPIPAEPGVPVPTPEPRPGSLRPGTYEVYISVGTLTGTPRIALPLAHDDGSRRYRLGTLEAVQPTQTVITGPDRSAPAPGRDGLTAS